MHYAFYILNYTKFFGLDFISSADIKAGQETDISVCLLSGCCFFEQLALRAMTHYVKKNIKRV